MNYQETNSSGQNDEKFDAMAQHTEYDIISLISQSHNLQFQEKIELSSIPNLTEVESVSWYLYETSEYDSCNGDSIYNKFEIALGLTHFLAPQSLHFKAFKVEKLLKDLQVCQGFHVLVTSLISLCGWLSKSTLS